MNSNGLASRPLKADATVTFKPGMRPVNSDLPEFMQVFISDRRQTVVIINGRPRYLATVALMEVK